VAGDVGGEASVRPLYRGYALRGGVALG
jgi:S-adenosylmethionine-diacylgycerolhomoserine-N-methlytransferase